MAGGGLDCRHGAGLHHRLPGGGKKGSVVQRLPLVELPVAYTGMVCPVVLVWYIITELGSMAENAADMGSDVPPWLLRLLAVGKNAIDDAGEAIAGEIPHEAHKIQGGVQR